jgi:hypothetical protein
MRHPDHEFLYQVGTTADGRPIYTSHFFIPKPTADLRDRGNELRPADRTRIPCHTLGTE